ncbi:MAG TPA: efflux RND transporter periplasmic adaptor subunit, partial [Hyalangium sp.]|nr:efflux RND transporter periplasmic adaptor subunit [Hyalangium sp.]
MKKVILIIGALAVAAAGVYFVRGRPDPKASQRELPSAEAKRLDLEIAAEASGLLEPIRVVEVKSKASGEVLRVLVETGSKVAQGDLLTEIDPRDVQNALTQAEADLESAQVRLKTVDAQRQRMEALRSTGVVTQQELETAVDAAATARAALVRAETNLQLARERRKDVTIRAPIAGTILERTIEPGLIIASATTNVSGGTTLFKMADMAEMQVRAKIDETDIGKIHAGQEARVSLEAYPGRSFIGEVVKIEPQAVVEQNVTLFPVLIRLKNPEGLLKPGMNAEVSIEIASRRDVVTVPNTAVVSPREAVSAAAALGLDEAAVRATLRPGGESPANSQGQQPNSQVVQAAAQGQQPPGQEQQPSGSRRQRGGGNPDRRPGVVFVQQEGGPQPRRVLLGLSDWEYSEVISGLEAGEKVLLVSVAQLQQQQQQSMERMRQRAGGVIPGAGGGARGGGAV